MSMYIYVYYLILKCFCKFSQEQPKCLNFLYLLTMLYLIPIPTYTVYNNTYIINIILCK